jgi:hypothetical protein
MLALALLRAAPEPSSLPVVHFAPEKSLVPVLVGMFGRDYVRADINIDRYADRSSTPLLKVDLCTPLNYFKPNSLGGMIHSHVLEHVPSGNERSHRTGRISRVRRSGEKGQI